MKSVTFTIEKAEVERIARKKLKPKELETILSMVENDTVLWDDIEESIARRMSYKGIIIEESLENKDVLQAVTILSTKVEEVTEGYKTPWIKQWTLHTVEVAGDRGEEIAEKLSQALDSQHAWHADFRSDKFDYIIFRNKIFKIDRSKPEEYKEVTKYGLSRGIPDYQLDFSLHIAQWQRDSS